MPPLKILAQPKKVFRERYKRDIDPLLNRSQRFIQAEDNPMNFRYPTVEISKEWFNGQQQPYYIHLTVCTITRENSSVRYIHPYPLDNEDTTVIKESSTNSLYFLITDDDLANGYKSLPFTKSKLPQYELKDYGPLKKLDPNEPDEQRLDEPLDAKKMIETYQLDQSQLLFSVATFEKQNNLPVIYGVSSVLSWVIIGNTTSPTANDDEITFRCSPQNGDEQGRDQILMFIPKIDKRKAFTVHFIQPSGEEIPAIQLEFVDAKTILFYTPPCPVKLTRSQPYAIIPIVVSQNNTEVARVDFVYQSLNRCLSCGSNYVSTPFEETDEVPMTSQNLIVKKNDEIRHSSVQNFIDKARFLSTIKAEDHFILLENAIQSGDDDSAQILISQSNNNLLERMNDQGETPLLLAARFNRDGLLRVILERRPELARQTDRQGNNLFHLLANVSNDRSKKTIANVLKILDDQIKETLMNQINQSQQTPEQVANEHRMS